MSYGCDISEVSPTLANILKVDNTALTNPCDIASINVTEWLIQQLFVDGNDYLFQLFGVDWLIKSPCIVWINPIIIKNILIPYGRTDVLDHNYWFGDDGKCDTLDVTNNNGTIISTPCDKNCSFEIEQS